MKRHRTPWISEPCPAQNNRFLIWIGARSARAPTPGLRGEYTRRAARSPDGVVANTFVSMQEALTTRARSTHAVFRSFRKKQMQKRCNCGFSDQGKTDYPTRTTPIIATAVLCLHPAPDAGPENSQSGITVLPRQAEDMPAGIIQAG